ncbi:MAG: dihydroneopterin aldolase [Methylotenera sp.]|uniref:dihydroneopterin aldolase n=1 Tax=Methylotenera sp. TaxID=2051956 RepID=UPI00182DF711|nr:dihydroneopterin aldolase [Methylotenera sp.]NOU26086.1 dihydroneopterin aldolase [Methylotenera sp.]
MDTIFISELKVQTKLGVPEWERMMPQTIILDVEIGYDLSKACKSDAIADTIDYGAVVSRIRETLTESSFKLVEALAEYICQLILKEFGALSVKVKVAKPAIMPRLKALGVVIERVNNNERY